MTTNADTAMPARLLGEVGGDPIEDRLRETVRATVEALFDEELAAYLGRLRYGRGDGARKGCRHGRRKVKVDRDGWAARSLAEEDVVRLILEGTVIRRRLDRKAPKIPVLAAIGVRRDGQKILLSIRHIEMLSDNGSPYIAKDTQTLPASSA